ncbi:O-antigen ligase family protein [Dyella humicola]|uniref:O-antigen ligase family protein n=1 Tax=Dyella humicola TaxID=2992126 RepID=UPI0022551297|nr:O-antigen ligase family protein [Dyella humicola]
MNQVPRARQAFSARTIAATLLLALLPISFAVPVKLKVVPIALLFFYGIGLLIADRDVRANYMAARAVVLVCALSMLYAIGNILGHRLGWGELDLPSHILAFLAIAAVFARSIHVRWFWLGLSLGAAALGLVCIYQHYIQGAPRATGLDGADWGVIELAMFILVLSLSAVVQMLRPQLSWPERALHAACAVLGSFGALLTQSRGPLLACAPVFLLVVLLHVVRTKQWRDALIVLGGAVAIAAVSVVFLRGEIMQRFTAIGHEVTTYRAEDSQGAVRERIEMWRVASRAFMEHPVAGVGIDQFGKYTQTLVSKGLASESIARYTHPHSEYLDAAVCGGVPGLIVLLLLLGVPMVFFARRVFDPCDIVATTATIGLLTVSMYALCGFTDNVLYRPMPHSLFFFLTLGMAVLASRLQRERALREIAAT